MSELRVEKGAELQELLIKCNVLSYECGESAMVLLYTLYEVTVRALLD